MQTDATVPVGVQGLNWGAFLLSWIWAIFNQVWIGLLALVPCVNVFVMFYLLFKGNELAWNGPRQWESEEQFRTVQAAWMKWGIIVLVVGIATNVIFGGAIMAFLLAAVGSSSASPR